LNFNQNRDVSLAFLHPQLKSLRGSVPVGVGERFRDMSCTATQLKWFNRLSGEINIDSIRALDEQIKKHEEILSRLIRTRNSLLDVHRLPPERLGDIFYRNLMFKGDFDRFYEGSHNFMLVCHHWLEVASSTPDLWSFWCITLGEWARWHDRSASAPVDLVLDDVDDDERYFDDTISNAQPRMPSDGFISNPRMGTS
jgi:hypothetical protein